MKTLSCSSIAFLDDRETTLVDSGSVAHAPQTLALLDQVLAGRLLTLLIDSHPHSDHIGGNAAVWPPTDAASRCRPAWRTR
jgi:glyoxylase-like metal-dependent hydrolase (beta-lactamase superfamily II)